jgi:hypothetical protein
MSSDKLDQIPFVAIVDEICDVEESERPFGKRWAQQRIRLDESHLNALREGKKLALDVNEEYVVFLELDVKGA